MSRKIFLRDGADKPHEIVIYDNDQGEIISVGLTDAELLDLTTNLDAHVRPAWQRIKREKTI